MAFELVPADLIHQLQRSLCLDSSLPISSSSLIPPIEDADADADADASVRCGRCGGGGMLFGRDSGLCVYCGGVVSGGEGEEEVREISFRDSVGYEWLLGSLGLDGSDPVTINSELTEPNKGRDPPRTNTVLLSDVLDLKLRLSPNKTTNQIQTEPISTPYTLNLSGIDVDSIFKETKKEIPLNQVNKPSLKSQNFVNTKPNMMNFVKAESSQSFAKWDADFQPNNETESSSVTKIGNSNDSFVVTEHLKPHSMDKLPINPSELSNRAEKLSLDDDDFDDWNNFAGSAVAQNEEKNESCSSDPLPVISINRSENNLEELNAEKLSEDFDDWNNFAGSAVAQIEEKNEPCSSDDLPVISINRSDNNVEASKAVFDEQKDLTRSQNELADNKDTLNANNDDNSFDDWNDFTGSNAIQKTGSVSFDSLPVMNKEPSDNSKELVINSDDLFVDWKDFSAQSGLTGQDEISKPASVDPLSQQETALNADFDDWKDLKVSNAAQSGLTGQGENTGPASVDPLSQQEGALNADFGDWKNFKVSNVAQSGLTGLGENTGPVSVDPLSQQEALNAEFDDWNDFSGSNIAQSGLMGQEKTEPGPLNQQEALNAEFDDWQDLTKSNVGQSGQPSDDLFEDWQDFTTSSQITTEQNPKKDASSQKTTEQNHKNQDDDVASDDWSTAFDAGFQQALDASVDQSDEWLGLERKTELMERLESKRKNGNLNSTDDWLDITGSIPQNPKSVSNEKESKLNNDLFDDWKNFAGSSSEVKKDELSSKEGNLNLDLDFWGSESKKTELGSESKGFSDDWLGFSTGSSQVKGNNNNNSTELVGKNNDNSDDWMDLWKSSTNSEEIKLEGIKKENDDALNNWHDNIDSLNRRIETNGDSASGPALSESKSGPEPTNDVEKFLSQMNDLSFMLKDELSVPNNPNSK
ncbi:hypothetical protein LUZ60_002861 [Juncus effusus]|nr:hypothetical protein LUZ60_002861 [Juncus effusus]